MACSKCEAIRAKISEGFDMEDFGIVGRFQKWIAAPVAQDMDLVDVALTTVFVLSVAFAWTRVLKHID